MITFIAIISVVNLALGYGLAVYLGHASLGLALRRRAPSDSVDKALPVQGTADERAGSVIADSAAVNEPLTNESATSRPTVKSANQMPSVETSDVAQEPVATELENRDAASISENSVEKNQQGDSGDDESGPQAELQEVESPVVDEAVVEEVATVEAEATAANTASRLEKLAALQPPADSADSQPASEEDLLAGIAAFRAQLAESDPEQADSEGATPTEKAVEKTPAEALTA